MAKIITFGIQKGGCGKSTTSGITAYLLTEMGYKVLAIDMDSQGNLTQFLSGIDDLTVFEHQTIKQAMESGDVVPFIRHTEGISNLDYVPSDDYLVLISDTYTGSNKLLLLANCLASVQKDYDFIIIDTPPALSLECRNALCASDFVVVMFETSKFCYNAIPRFLDAIQGAKENINPKVKVAGILTTLADSRRTDSNDLAETVQYQYPSLAFKSIIKRTAATGRLPFTGFTNNPELKKGIEQHFRFVKELLDRVNGK